MTNFSKYAASGDVAVHEYRVTIPLPSLPASIAPTPTPSTTPSPGLATMASSVSEYGITWYFDKSYPVGQFVNGDWWVVGPVTIVDVNPRPGVAPANEVNNLGTNRWGDTGLQDDKSRRNGSMVVMTPGLAQGYDSRGITYNSSSSITFPYKLATNRSLISSISEVTAPNQVMHYH